MGFVKSLKLGRKKQARGLMIKNLATSLILYEKIVTTHQKAKVTASYVDRVLTTAKLNLLHKRRIVSKMLANKKAVAKLFDIGVKNLLAMPQNSGFVSVLKISKRVGDNAQQSVARLNPDIFKIAVEKPSNLEGSLPASKKSKAKREVKK